MNSFIDSSLSDVMPGNMLEPLSYTFNPLTDNLSSPHQIGGSFSDDGFVSGMIRALGQLKQAPGVPGLVPKTARQRDPAICGQKVRLFWTTTCIFWTAIYGFVLWDRN